MVSRRREEIKYGHQKYQEMRAGGKRGICTAWLHILLYLLNQYPLATSLDELVEHQAHIGQRKAADVKTEEFSSMPCAEF